MLIEDNSENSMISELGKVFTNLIGQPIICVSKSLNLTILNQVAEFNCVNIFIVYSST